MRVITGEAKGRRLFSPKSTRIRPALDQVKEAVFNILFDVTDLRVLDLFAGTGSMGIEALSRGAKHATFVDDFASAITIIRKNLKLCGFEGRADVFHAKAMTAIKRLSKQGKSFGLIFVDPPYLKNFVVPTLLALSQSDIILSSSIIIVEHHPKEPIGPIEKLKVVDSRRYGQTLITFLKNCAVRIDE